MLSCKRRKGGTNVPSKTENTDYPEEIQAVANECDSAEI